MNETETGEGVNETETEEGVKRVKLGFEYDPLLPHLISGLIKESCYPATFDLS